MKPSYKIALFVIAIIWIIIGVFSCQSDVQKPVSQIEQQYFNDYTSPQYKWGFIDKTGQPVIDAIYDDVRDAKAQNIAANLNGKWGFIDLKGNNRIEHKFKQAFDFSEGRCFVQDFNNNWLLINELGDSIKQLKYTSFKPFRDGFSIVGQANKYGVIDTSGSLLLEVIYPNLKYLNNGLFLAATQKYGIIDKNGQTTLPFEYDKIYGSDNEIIRVKEDNVYLFYNTKKGNFSQGNFKNNFDYDGEFALVKTENGYSSIDKNFNIVHDFKYSYLEPIDGGFLKYKSHNNLYGIVDYQGQELTDAQFELLNRFRSNRIVFSKNNSFGYIDNEGNKLIPPILPLVWDFKDDLARVIAGNGIGFIDKNGKMIIEDRFYEVKDFNNGIARYQSIR